MSNQIDSGFYRLTQILEQIPIRKSSWFAGVRDGRYPKPIKLGPRVSLWRKSDIQSLIQKISDGAHTTSQVPLRAIERNSSSQSSPSTESNGDRLKSDEVEPKGDGRWLNSISGVNHG